MSMNNFLKTSAEYSPKKRLQTESNNDWASDATFYDAKDE